MKLISKFSVAIGLAIAGLAGGGDVYANSSTNALSSIQAVDTDAVDDADLERAWSMTPYETRAGFLKFTTTEATQAELAPGFIDRLRHGGEDSEVRAAIVEVLSRSEGEWYEAITQVAESEQDVLVKEHALFALKRVPIEMATPAILTGLNDRHASVRMEAARVIGAHIDGASLIANLLPLLKDPDVEVQAMAARTMGWKTYAPAFDALRPLLNSGDPQVRLRALRAMSQIDPGKTAGLSELSTLRLDTDGKVSRLADRLVK